MQPTEPTKCNDSSAHAAMSNTRDGMSLGGCDPEQDCGVCGRRLHRLRTVREREQVSRRVVARRLGVCVTEVKRQEDESHDVLLSQLLQWQEALSVPLADLLVDPGDSLAPAVGQRAALLRTMKTAKLLLKLANGERVGRLATMLVDELITLMPEVRHVSAWPTHGQQRTIDEYGVIAERTVPDGVFAIHRE